MILVTSKDKTHLELNDKQLSILMSALSCATLKWNKIKDKKSQMDAKRFMGIKRIYYKSHL